MLHTKHPVEKYFHHVSRYHFYCLGIMFATKIPLYWHIMSIIFLSPPMTFQCNDLSIRESGECPCDDPNWNRSVFTETVQTKFDILCDRQWLISFSESMLYVGTLIGSMVFGFLSDKYGRLFIFSTCSLSLAVTGCLVSVMHTTTLFIIMRCLEGIGIGGAIVTGFVFIVEYCGTRYRDTVAAMYHVPLTIGHVTLAGVSYLIRDCDLFQLALSLPVFLVALSWFFLRESPKWLVDNGHIDKAARVMKKIAEFNKTPACDMIEAEMQEYHADQSSTAHKKVSFFQIFKYKKLAVNFLSMSAIYLICGMGYYGVSQYIGRMSGDIHRNVAISGLFLIPGTLAAIFLLRLLSRRLFLIICNMLAGIFMIAVISIPANMKITRMAVASLSNTCFFVSFIIIFLYGVELFPTGIRNSVLGVLSVLSRIGMIIAPPINALNATVAGAIFGVSAILGAVLCYPLPETKNVALPSTIEESRALSRHSILSSLYDRKKSVVE